MTFVVVTQDTKSLVFLLLAFDFTEDLFFFDLFHFTSVTTDNVPLSMSRRRRFAKPHTIDKKEGKVPPLPPSSERLVP